MHAKRIKGKNYFYTSYRDRNGNIKTRYLGRNREEALKKEIELEGGKDYLFNLIIIFTAFIGFFTIFQSSFTGFYVAEGGGSAPEINGIAIYNNTDIFFNNSIIGYGNYSDSEGDDSGGSSWYDWIINGEIERSGFVREILFCRYDMYQNCSQNETALVNQIHNHFNNSNLTESIQFIEHEKNTTLVYLNIPKSAKIISAFLNITGQKYDDIDSLYYNSLENESKSDGGGDMSGGVLGGAASDTGLDSWFLMDSPVNSTINMLEIMHGESFEEPSRGNFFYNLKMCPTSLDDLSNTTDPDGNCSSAYKAVRANFNLSATFSDTSNSFANISFDEKMLYTFSDGNNYIIKFEFVSGITSTSRLWRFYYDNNPGMINYVSWDEPSYNFAKGLPLVKFYVESRYPDYATLDVGNDGDVEFNSSVTRFSTVNKTQEFSSEIMSYLSSCSPDSDNYCDVPLNLTVDTIGKVELDDVRVDYPHFVEGKFGKGVSFNDTFTLRYNYTNNFNVSVGTMEMWVKPWWGGTNNSEHYFFDEKSNSNRMYLRKNNTHLIFGAFDKDNASYSVSYSLSPWSSEEWHLIATTWNLSNGSLKLYTDGVLRDSLATSEIDLNETGEYIFIGSREDNRSQAKAVIDELRISEYEKKSDELKFNYNLSIPYFENSVFLNLTSLYIRGNDSIKFRLTPSDTSQNGTPKNSSALVVSNIPPFMVQWVYPLNNTYTSNTTNSYHFQWDNSTDDDRNNITYYMEIDDDDDFSSPEYTNSSIGFNDLYLEGGVEDGNYSLRVRAMDGMFNSSWSDSVRLCFDISKPNLTLVIPLNNSAVYSKNTYFNYSIDDSNGIVNCSLSINGVLNSTNGPSGDYFNVTIEPLKYYWVIDCYDNALNLNPTEISWVSVVHSNDYEVSDLSGENLSGVDNFFIKNDYGGINYTEKVDLDGGLDINQWVNITFNRAEVHSVNESKLNKKAMIELYDERINNPIILKDGGTCPADECTRLSYDLTTGLLVFNVSGFTVYSATDTPSVPAAITGGGHTGTGGGSTGLKKSSDFEISEKILKFKLQQYTSVKGKVSVKNTGEKGIDMEVSHNMPNVIILDSKKFRLDVGEEEIVTMDVFGESPGIKSGKISFKTGDIQKQLPVILEIESGKALFDTKIDIAPDDREIYEGDKLETQITLFNVGERKEVDVTLTYLIKDFDGNKIYEESETFAVNGQRSFTKQFDTSSLGEGDYVVGISLLYSEGVATSSATFKILPLKIEFERMPFIERNKVYIVITAIIFILVAIIFLERMNYGKLIGRRKRKLKRY